jgi:hypothetical protein
VTGGGEARLGERLLDQHDAGRSDDIRALIEIDRDVAQAQVFAGPMERAEFKRWVGRRDPSPDAMPAG